MDMGRIIGTHDVVEVDNTDEVIYGVRKNRHDDGLVPFTKSRSAEPCRYVALQLVPQKDDTYELSSAGLAPLMMAMSHFRSLHMPLKEV